MNGLAIAYTLLLLVVGYGLYRSKDVWFNLNDFNKGAKFMAGMALALILLISLAVFMLRN